MEPKVEADRALETARKIRKLSAALPIAWNEKAVEDIASLIQSAIERAGAGA